MLQALALGGEVDDSFDERDAELAGKIDAQALCEDIHYLGKWAVDDSDPEKRAERVEYVEALLERGLPFLEPGPRGREAPASVLLMLDGLSLVEGVHEAYLRSLALRDGADGRRVFEGVVRSVEEMIEVGRHLAAALDCEAEALEIALRELRDVPVPREVRVAAGEREVGGNGGSDVGGGVQMTLWEN